MFGEAPGSYDICPVCFWEDDHVQLRWPDFAGGANGPSLIDSQKNYEGLGAMEARFVSHVRPPLDVEPLDPGWHRLDRSVDQIAVFDAGAPWPNDLTTLYWWR